jgi:hypothetical protein
MDFKKGRMSLMFPKKRDPVCGSLRVVSRRQMLSARQMA